MVILIVGIRFIVTHIPKDMNIDFFTKKEESNRLYFPLKKRLAFILNGIEGCTKEDRSFPAFYDNEIISTGSSCWNGDCELTVEFSDTIPKTVELYVKEKGACQQKEFKVPRVLDTIGYRVDLQLTQKQRLDLGGIGITKNIRLEHAKGYSLTHNHKYYFYDKKLDKDIILLDDEELDTVYFKKQH
jgi:hypothetical protein